MSPSPYAAAAWDYRRAGWKGVLPLPPGRKKYPPEGFTGHKGAWPYPSEIQDWIESRPYGNICLRLPKDGLGIDVDAYGEKQGAKTLAELEAKLGPLPPTIVSTSRDDGVSGIKLYRVPVRPGWRGKAGDNIEIIHFGHRYVIVWPSINPENYGRLYRWIDERTGEVLDHLPRFEDLPELPQAWVDFLSSDSPGPDKADVTAQEAHDWFKSLSNGTRCQPVVEKLVAFHQALKSGSRHEAGLDCALALARFGALGHHDVRNAVIEARGAFLDAVQADGHGKRVQREAEAEWARLVVSAYGVIRADPKVVSGRKCLCLPEFTGESTGNEDAPQNGSRATPTQAARVTLPPEFWESRKVLRHIRQAAHSRQRSADAVLHSTLARVAAIVSHHNLLPATVGSKKGLSYYAAIVALPGIGKGDCAMISVEILPAPDYVGDQLPLGSGEGLAELLFDVVEERDDKGKAQKVKRQTRNNIFLYIDEGQMMGALGSRNGATIFPTLRSIWSGNVIGQSNANHDRRRIVPAYSYVYGLVVGFQPIYAAELLDDADGGTPQRFGWAMATDPTIPQPLPEWPGQLAWEPPPGIELDGVYKLDPAIEEEIRADDLMRARGEKVPDTLDAQAGLFRLKVAALLATLDDRADRTKINIQDWELAGMVQKTSNAVRDAVAQEVAEEGRRREADTSARLARRHVHAAASEENRQVVKCAQRIRDKVTECPGVTRNNLQRQLSRKQRDVLEDALDHAKAKGWIEERTTPSHTGDDQRTFSPKGGGGR